MTKKYITLKDLSFFVFIMPERPRHSPLLKTENLFTRVTGWTKDIGDKNQHIKARAGHATKLVLERKGHVTRLIEWHGKEENRHVDESFGKIKEQITTAALREHSLFEALEGLEGFRFFRSGKGAEFLNKIKEVLNPRDIFIQSLIRMTHEERLEALTHKIMLELNSKNPDYLKAEIYEMLYDIAFNNPNAQYLPQTK